ncbi:MAG: ATP-dependent helicase [Candidatus Moraniibacteriota bacterium]|nr:MAG: ATP-dependent helicase [Candidatus Moranbacteria bacterium]
MSDIKEFQKNERDRLTKELVESDDRFKLVIAGAGTGKSFTFKSLLQQKKVKSLALTFINNLADELKKDLSGLAEAHTFHGYCKKLLHTLKIDGLTSSFYYFPKLPLVIKSDNKYLTGDKYKNFRKVFQNLNKGEELKFFLTRATYYNAVGHDDAVYRVLQSFKKDSSVIPTYGQIVVDEYQDFNLLEVSFLEELSKLSPTLIVGDDDQAVYEDLKDASPRFIRNKASDKNFIRFSLPFCSRCTEVIISAVHDIIGRAQAVGRLVGRINKEYVCYLPDKEAESVQYPKIIHARCSLQRKTDNYNYIGKYIESEINKITPEDWVKAQKGNYPCVLIAGQTQYLNQVYGYLSKKFKDIDFKETTNDTLNLLDGYLVLLKNNQSNLGWRVLSEIEMKKKILKQMLVESEQNQVSLVDLIPADFKDEHLAVLEILKKVKKDESLSEDEEEVVTDKLAITIEELKKVLKKDPEAEDKDKKQSPIKITSFNGCKGLSASFVFLVGLNNTEFPKIQKKPTDKEICQFIVGLTRTRKQCYLISNKSFATTFGMNQSVFIDRIDSSRISNVIVDANFFKNLNN